MSSEANIVVKEDMAAKAEQLRQKRLAKEAIESKALADGIEAFKAKKEARKAALKIEVDRLRSINSNITSNAGAVEGGNSEYKYSWINNGPHGQALYRIYLQRGYEVVDDSNDPKVQTDHKNSDGTHTRDDLILMRVLTIHYEALQYLKEERSFETSESVEERLVNWMETNEVPYYQMENR